MKKYISVVAAVAVIITSYCLIIHSMYKAEHVDDKIVYNGITYLDWADVSEKYRSAGVVNSIQMEPYELVDDELREKIYVTYNDFSDFLPPFNYFSFCGETDDLIIFGPNDTSLQLLYVKEGFAFPDIQNCKVDEIWLSLNSEDKENIKDEKIITQLVDCMKNTADREIDKEIYDYIVENSWDNSHFYLKYNGYPLVEEFYVSTDRNGKYIVSQ